MDLLLQKSCFQYNITSKCKPVVSTGSQPKKKKKTFKFCCLFLRISYMCTMRCDHIQPSFPPSNSPQHTPTQFNVSLFQYLIPVSVALYIHRQGVFTQLWKTYQWPYPPAPIHYLQFPVKELWQDLGCLDLPQSCAGNHNCYRFMSIVALLCPEDSISPHSSLSSSSSVILTSSSAMMPEPWWSRG